MKLLMLAFLLSACCGEVEPEPVKIPDGCTRMSPLDSWCGLHYAARPIGFWCKPEVQMPGCYSPENQGEPVRKGWCCDIPYLQAVQSGELQPGEYPR